jgi:hypothetical protein
MATKTRSRPRNRSKQYVFLPTAKQMEAIEALTTARKKLDEHVSQGAVIRELVQRGLDALQNP